MKMGMYLNEGAALSVKCGSVRVVPVLRTHLLTAWTVQGVVTQASYLLEYSPWMA
jgi:hypothetical protein